MNSKEREVDNLVEYVEEEREIRGYHEQPRRNAARRAWDVGRGGANRRASGQRDGRLSHRAVGRSRCALCRNPYFLVVLFLHKAMLDTGAGRSSESVVTGFSR